MKFKEIQNLSITEYILSIITFNYQPIIFKNYFSSSYYDKITNLFNETFIKNKKEEIIKF